ncbi:MAG: hypothetical protein MIO93_14060, partial [ANME-2 cluster archaeon]|nr:hypothetical protein [ANME-2 cluster archaeon]
MAMAVKLQHKRYSNTLHCTRCPKGGRVQPAVWDNGCLGISAGHKPGSCIQLLCRWSAVMAVEIYKLRDIA